MSIIADLLKDIPLPRMAPVRQNFPQNGIGNVAGALRAELGRPEIAGRVKPGMRIAVAVGSRGMAEVQLLVRVLVEELKRLGAAPFIVPAMGSHGGATAEGQTEVLRNLGVTEESAGCPVRSSMDVVELGVIASGLPVLIDRNAYEADGIVVLNRIKPHTGFSGPNESGLVKMITIGLGKQRGADSCHQRGFGEMAEFIVEMARIKIEKTPILFGIATVEDSYDKVARIAAIPAENIVEAERELLVLAKAGMPKILPQKLDILVVDEMGKEYSGSGMDPHITGRAPTPYLTGGPVISRLVVLDLSERSHGNATGMGNADIATRRLFEKVDFDFTYANVLTATATNSGRIPMFFDNDRLALQAAVKTSLAPDFSRIRMVRIPNTLHLGEVWVSEALIPEAEAHPLMEVLGPPEPLLFDAAGNLTRSAGH